MPQTAVQTWDNRNMIGSHYEIPRGISVDNQELSESGVRSRGDFYAKSAALRYFSLPFTLDTSSVVDRHIREAVKDTLTKLQKLLTWDTGWNGYDALAPDPNAVRHAENWIRKLFLEVAASDRTWIPPNVTASADGEVVFEWWYGTKKLTIYVSGESVEYVKVWGTDINSEMSDGEAESVDMCRALWLWLVG